MGRMENYINTAFQPVTPNIISVQKELVEATPENAPTPSVDEKPAFGPRPHTCCADSDSEVEI